MFRKTALCAFLCLPLWVSHALADPIKWKNVYSEEFKDDSWRSGWTVRVAKNHLNTYMNFNESAVSLVDNDYIQFKTTRHCVDKVGDELTNANASENPCPSGKTTQYLSGRISSANIVDGSKPFRAEIRAKINWNGLTGVRPSLWMRNSVDLQTCHRDPNANDAYGELDILEWYSSTPSYTWSSSHITCFHSEALKTWRTRNFGHRLDHRVNKKQTSLANEWHVWAVEYDGEKVRYFVDDELVVVHQYRASDAVHMSTIDTTVIDEKGRNPSTMPDENFALLGVDEALIKKVFDDKWYFILNDYVESKANERPPSLTEKFPSQTVWIDYVRLYQQAEDDPQPTPGQVHKKYAPIDTNYPIPADNVLWVSPTGNDSAAGTQNAPLQTVVAAFRKATNGTTIVLKSGAYREPHFFLTENKQNITLQAEPHGDVWFKGSDVIAPERWEKEGNLWKVTGNFYNFCRVCTEHEDPDFDGIASHPEQVFINDEPLRQVASKEEVVPGTFYVHDPNPTTLKVPKKTQLGFNIGPQDPLTYYLGSDPTKGITEISERPRAFTSVVKGLKVLGINFAHYSPHQRWDYNDPVHGHNAGAVAVTINRDNSLIENGIFTQNTNTALSIQGKNITVRGNRFIENGSNGFGNNRGDNAIIENNYFRNNNTDGHIINGTYCTAWCVTGHLKMTHAKNLTFRYNIMDDSGLPTDKRLGGYWCDEGCINAKVIGNFFTNMDAAIVYEVSDSGIIASNIIENSDIGISLAGASNTRVYNNTLSRNHRPIVLREDPRFDGCHNADCSAKDEWSASNKLSWDNRNIEIYNNILSSRTLRRADETWWPYIISIGADNRDGKRRIYSNDNFRGLDYNAYYRASLTQEPNLITFDLPGEKESIDLIFKTARELGVHPRVNRKINGLERQALDLFGSRAQNPYFVKEADGDLAFKQSNYHLRDDSPAKGSGKPLPADVLRAIDPERRTLKAGQAVDRGALVNILFDATNGKANTLLREMPEVARQTQNRVTPLAAVAKANQLALQSQGLSVNGNDDSGTRQTAALTTDSRQITLQKENAGYSQVRPYSEGLAAVEKNGRWGFIDEKGKEVVRPSYNAVQNFSDSRAAVQINGQWGFIDKSGKIVVNTQYSDVWSYRNGQATVRQGGYLQVIDKQGNVIKP